MRERKMTMGMIRCFNCMEVFDDSFEVCPHCGYITNSLPAVAYHLYPRTKLNDRYVIGTVIGHGGFGITYNAWDTTLNVHVAIKEFFPNGLVNRIPGTTEVIILSGDKQVQYQNGLERFLDEAKNTVAFGAHPNIVNVFSYFEENNTAYIVMEFLNGQSVSAYIKQWDGILRLDESLEITAAVCDALIEIHSHGIIHRDINPGNIFLCDKGIKLIDFGAARISETEFEKTRSIVITPGYAPPEQYQSKSKQGPWTDIYAISATLYRMLTGKRPLESIDRMVDDQLEMPRTLNSEIPEWLEHIIMNGMALNATLRFQTAAELKSAIESETMQELPEERIRKRKRKRVILFSAITAGAVAAAGVAIAYAASHRGVQIEKGTSLTVEVPEGQEALYQSLYDSYFPAEYRALLEMHFTADAEHPQIYLKGQHDELAAADLSHFYSSIIQPEDYYFLPQMIGSGRVPDSVPISYYEILAYVSNAYMETSAPELAADRILTTSQLAESSFLSIAELEPRLPEVITESADAVYAETADAVEQFVLRDADIFIATSAQYQQILHVCDDYDNKDSTIALNYSIFPIYDGESALGFLGDAWCVAGDADAAQVNAAEYWLEFLLQDSVQELLFISGEETLSAIPVSKKAFQEYLRFKTAMAEFLQTDVTRITLPEAVASGTQ